MAMELWHQSAGTRLRLTVVRDYIGLLWPGITAPPQCNICPATALKELLVSPGKSPAIADRIACMSLTLAWNYYPAGSPVIAYPAAARVAIRNRPGKVSRHSQAGPTRAREILPRLLDSTAHAAAGIAIYWARESAPPS
jgi:hypothetical protein